MWLSANQARDLVREHGSPLFVYSSEILIDRAKQLTQLELPFGHTVRFAVKANPHPEIIQLFADQGLYFDASSSYEVSRLLEQGIDGSKISLSSQQPAHNLPELFESGVKIVATSLHQLELVGKSAPQNITVALRINPGMGSGHNNRTSTGGTASSFGIWHEYLPLALDMAERYDLVVDRLHVHVGSGADPSVWSDVMDTALTIVAQMPDVTTLDIGGGYKIARTAHEQEANMPQIAAIFSDHLQRFAEQTGRKLHLEIEPGTWLVGHAGILLAEVVDIVDTGKEGFTFLRLNTGMNDIMRPAMYGAQHHMEVLNTETEQLQYVVVGHNCETGDILSPAPGDPEAIKFRTMNRAGIGDTLAIADTGAYCASFSAKQYNDFPTAAEIIV